MAAACFPEGGYDLTRCYGLQRVAACCSASEDEAGVDKRPKKFLGAVVRERDRTEALGPCVSATYAMRSSSRSAASTSSPRRGRDQRVIWLCSCLRAGSATRRTALCDSPLTACTVCAASSTVAGAKHVAASIEAHAFFERMRSPGFCAG